MCTLRCPHKHVRQVSCSWSHLIVVMWIDFCTFCTTYYSLRLFLRISLAENGMVNTVGCREDCYLVLWICRLPAGCCSIVEFDRWDAILLITCLSALFVRRLSDNGMFPPGSEGHMCVLDALAPKACGALFFQVSLHVDFVWGLFGQSDGQSSVKNNPSPGSRCSVPTHLLEEHVFL